LIERKGSQVTKTNAKQKDDKANAAVEMLTKGERRVMGLLGTGLLVASLTVASPIALPSESWTTDAFGARTRSDYSRESVVRTPEFLALLAGGLLLILVSLNGRRISRVKIRDMEFDSCQGAAGKELAKHLRPQLSTDSEVEEAPKEVLPAGSAIAVESIGEGDDVGIYSLDDVPARVISDAIANWPDDAGVAPANVAEFVVAIRRFGRGNHPWFVEFKNRRPVKVSYGGRGKDESTVTAV